MSPPGRGIRPAEAALEGDPPRSPMPVTPSGRWRLSTIGFATARLQDDPDRALPTAQTRPRTISSRVVTTSPRRAGCIERQMALTDTGRPDGGGDARRPRREADRMAREPRPVLLPRRPRRAPTTQPASARAPRPRRPRPGGRPGRGSSWPPTASPVLPCSADVDEDVLGLRVEVERAHPELAADARHLVAAERRLGVDRAVRVDADDTRLEGLRGAQRLADVATPDRALTGRTASRWRASAPPLPCRTG